MSSIGVVARTIRNIIGIPEPEPEVNSLTRALTAVREQIQILVGDKGDDLDRVATLRDLVALEVLKTNQSSEWDVTSLSIGAALGGGVIGFADKTVIWAQESGGGTWTPSTPQDITVSFRQGEEEVAEHVVRGSLNTGTGDITVSTQSVSGDTTTLNVTNNTTPTPTVNVVHNDSSVAVPITFASIEGGQQGPAGSDGADGADGTDGIDGVLPSGMTWGAGLTDVQMFINVDATGLPDDGEIRLTPGTLRMPDGSTRSFASDANVFTPYEGATVPPVSGNIFYLVWGASPATARFGGPASNWGNTAAVDAGFFVAYYIRPQWTAVDDLGNTFNFTPDSTDVIFAVGTKTTTVGGIESMTLVAPHTGDLGLFNTVPVGYIDPDAVGTLELAAEAVTNAKIAVDAVQQVNIATGAVGTDEISAGSVTANEIAANTITGDRIAANTIESGNLVSRTIQAGDIAVGGILAENIAAATITGSKIAANTIVSGNIATAGIQANNIAADAVTADKINVSNLAAISANMGTITAGSISATLITSDKLSTERISLDGISLINSGGVLVIGTADWSTQVGGVNKPDDNATRNVGNLQADSFRMSTTLARQVSTPFSDPINTWVQAVDGATPITLVGGTEFEFDAVGLYLVVGNFTLNALATEIETEVRMQFRPPGGGYADVLGGTVYSNSVSTGATATDTTIPFMSLVDVTGVNSRIRFFWGRTFPVTTTFTISALRENSSLSITRLTQITS